MTHYHCFEDFINPTSHADVIAEREDALAEQRRLIELVREQEPHHTARRVRHAPGWPPERFLGMRKRLGPTQNDMGRLLGVSAYAWRSWERGESVPNAANIARLEAMARGDEVAA